MRIECECREVCPCKDKAGPALYLIVRDGKEMKVCTRCILGKGDWSEGDKVVRVLEETDVPLAEFFEYDILGILAHDERA